MTISTLEDILPADYEPLGSVDVEATIPERFARIVAQCGDRIAVNDAGSVTTYAVLDRTSSAIAGEIVKRLGSAPEPVALIFHAGAGYHAAQLGVLKSGKFFASLDFNLPPERLLPLLNDLGPRLILCDHENAEKAGKLARTLRRCSTLVSPEVDPTEAGPSDEVQISPEGIAYVVYTSGSTGPPEGVLISHRSLLNVVRSHTNSVHLRKEDRGLQVCPLSYAASIGETFPILLTGGAVFPFNLKDLGGKRLVELLQKERITVCSLVPVAFRVLLASLADDQVLSDVRLIRLSGDRILKRDCVAFAGHFSDRCVLRASYASSEAQLCTGYFVHRNHIPDREVVPAGYACQDTDIYIIDDDGSRLGPNETGEIVIRSRYLSSGYWNNPDLTAQRFSAGGVDGEQIYFTRDLGYIEPDGCLVHVGRKDARVKIYGKMVTITDVEEALLAADGIEQAVVVAVARPDAETFLAAYYIAEDGLQPAPDHIRSILRTRFPAEIVPKKIIRLGSFPVTERNKIDRRRLASEVYEFERACQNVEGGSHT